MDPILKRTLELAGIKESSLSHGSLKDPTIKRENGKTLMIDLDGEDQWVDSEDEESALDYGYYYSNDEGASAYEYDKRSEANSKVAGMFEDDAQVSGQEALADKISVIIRELAKLYPPDGGNFSNPAKVIMLDDGDLNDPDVDVGFKTTIGIPVTKMVSVTRYNATQYEPEDVDDIEENHIQEMEIEISTTSKNGKQLITLFNDGAYDYESVDASMDTNDIVKAFASVINETQLGASGGENEYYSSYKDYKNSRMDDPI